MSGESGGWACEVPTEPRDNVQVSKIDFFDMTTICSGYRLLPVVACVRDFTVRTADRDLPLTDRESEKHVATAN